MQASKDVWRMNYGTNRKALMRKGLVYLSFFGWLALAFQPLPASGETIQFLTHNSEAQSYVGLQGELRGKPSAGNRAFYIELVREMIKQDGQQPPNIVNVPFKRGYKNTIDKTGYALFNVARTEDRDLMFQWVGPIWTFEDYFLKHRQSELALESLEDAREMSICVVRGNVHDQQLSHKGFKKLVRRNDYGACLQMLANKRVDLTPSALSGLGRKIDNAGVVRGQLTLTDVLVSQHNGYIAFNRQTAPLTVLRWQKALDAIKQDGRFDLIRQKYYTETDLSRLKRSR